MDIIKPPGGDGGVINGMRRRSQALSRVSGTGIDGCCYYHGTEVGTGRYMAKKEGTAVEDPRIRESELG